MPCCLQTFTTVRDGQREMCVMVYEGSNPTASKNKLLGQFQLVNIPLAAVGEPKLKVCALFYTRSGNATQSLACRVAFRPRCSKSWKVYISNHAVR